MKSIHTRFANSITTITIGLVAFSLPFVAGKPLPLKGLNRKSPHGAAKSSEPANESIAGGH